MSAWYCTTDRVTWPGCGRCGPCRGAAPSVFAEARNLRAALDRVRALCDTEDERARAEGYTAWTYVKFVRVAAAAPTEPAGEQWRTRSSGTPLGRNPDRVTRHVCGCITGWDDAYEHCVLHRCDDHNFPGAVPTEPAGGAR